MSIEKRIVSIGEMPYFRNFVYHAISCLSCPSFLKPAFSVEKKNIELKITNAILKKGFNRDYMVNSRDLRQFIAGPVKYIFVCKIIALFLGIVKFMPHFSTVDHMNFSHAAFLRSLCRLMICCTRP